MLGKSTLHNFKILLLHMMEVIPVAENAMTGNFLLHVQCDINVLSAGECPELHTVPKLSLMYTFIMFLIPSYNGAF